MTFSTLEIKRVGGGDSFDFFVDGQRFSQRFGNELQKRVSVFSFNRKQHEQAVRALLSGQEPEFPNGGVPLYICDQCGDLGCTAISARITFEDGYVSWHDFANDEPVAAVRFSERQYRTVLLEHQAALDRIFAPSP